MNVLIVTNSKYIPYTKLLLHSLFTQQPGEVKIYLFYQDLTAEDIRDMQTLVDRKSVV